MPRRRRCAMTCSGSSTAGRSSAGRSQRGSEHGTRHGAGPPWPALLVLVVVLVCGLVGGITRLERASFGGTTDSSSNPGRPRRPARHARPNSMPNRRGPPASSRPAPLCREPQAGPPGTRLPPDRAGPGYPSRHSTAARRRRLHAASPGATCGGRLTASSRSSGGMTRRSPITTSHRTDEGSRRVTREARCCSGTWSPSMKLDKPRVIRSLPHPENNPIWFSSDGRSDRHDRSGTHRASPSMFSISSRAPDRSTRLRRHSMVRRSYCLTPDDGRLAIVAARPDGVRSVRVVGPLQRETRRAFPASPTEERPSLRIPAHGSFSSSPESSRTRLLDPWTGERRVEFVESDPIRRCIRDSTRSRPTVESSRLTRAQTTSCFGTRPPVANWLVASAAERRQNRAQPERIAVGHVDRYGAIVGFRSIDQSVGHGF